MRSCFSTILIVCVLTGCGLGSSGGSSPSPEPQPDPTQSDAMATVTYDTASAAASIASATVGKLLSTSWAGGGSELLSTGPLGIPANTGVASSKPTATSHASSLPGLLVPFTRFAAKRAAQSIETTLNGSGAGTVHVTGDLDANNLGTLAFVYTGYNDGNGVIVDGNVSHQILSYDATTNHVTHGKWHFEVLRLHNATNDRSYQGDLDTVLNTSTLAETATLNAAVRNNLTQESHGYASYITHSTFANIYATAPQSMTVTGRVFTATLGFVDVSTTAPLLFSDASPDYPTGGGPLQLQGAASSAKILPLTADRVRIEVDGQDDGLFEFAAAYRWTDLLDNPLANDPPVVGVVSIDPPAPVASNALKAKIATLNDPDGDALQVTYRWRKNGSDVSGQTTDTLASGLFNAGDQIAVTASVSDGEIAVERSSDAVTVAP